MTELTILGLAFSTSHILAIPNRRPCGSGVFDPSESGRHSAWQIHTHSAHRRIRTLNGRVMIRACIDSVLGQ